MTPKQILVCLLFLANKVAVILLSQHTALPACLPLGLCQGICAELGAVAGLWIWRGHPTCSRQPVSAERSGDESPGGTAVGGTGKCCCAAAVPKQQLCTLLHVSVCPVCVSMCAQCPHTHTHVGAECLHALAGGSERALKFRTQRKKGSSC